LQNSRNTVGNKNTRSTLTSNFGNQKEDSDSLEESDFSDSEEDAPLSGGVSVLSSDDEGYESGQDNEHREQADVCLIGDSKLYESEQFDSP